MSLKVIETSEPDVTENSSEQQTSEEREHATISANKIKLKFSNSKFPIFWIDGFPKNSVIQAVVLCNWDNIYGPKVRNMWVIDDIPTRKNVSFISSADVANETDMISSEDRCLDWDTLSFIARQMLCSEIMKDPCDSFLENKFYDSPQKKLALAAIVFGAMSQTDMSIHSLCVVPSYNRLNEFHKWKDVCFEWLTNCVLQLRITLATNATAGFTIIKKNLIRLVHIMEKEEQAGNFTVKETFLNHLNHVRSADKPPTMMMRNKSKSLSNTPTRYPAERHTTSETTNTRVTSQHNMTTTTTTKTTLSSTVASFLPTLSTATSTQSAASTLTSEQLFNTTISMTSDALASVQLSSTSPQLKSSSTVMTTSTTTTPSSSTTPKTNRSTSTVPFGKILISDLEFFHNSLVAHLSQCHNSVVIGTDVDRVNEMIKALALFTLPHDAHRCKLLQPAINNNNSSNNISTQNPCTAQKTCDTYHEDLLVDIDFIDVYNARLDKHKLQKVTSAYAPELRVQGLLKSDVNIHLLLDNVMFSMRPTALIDVDTKEVMLICWTEQYDDMRHKFITNNLHKLWNECPPEQLQMRDVFKSVKVSKSLVHPFLQELCTLPCHLVRPRVNNFMKQLHRRALAFVQYVESRRKAGSGVQSSAVDGVSLVTLREHLGLNLDWDYHVISSFAEIVHQAKCERFTFNAVGQVVNLSFLSICDFI
ncbi:hypothetical protein HELRODRAFT_169022 [Helobdella robusta]|uniref:Uncharacterized protein n=1 Tax=Helobdella robusta TaxID=6412 RepID=T1F197_HELRO|nr:hypothetical protein HELRODRAFT_169022 [Helobdella robusta]ESO09082.1 hypothetical protein HELRODRAFT_169022 [Helobdella robusta]